MKVGKVSRVGKILGWGAAMGVLSFFVASCDREREATEGAQGKMVEVHVRILGVKEGQSEEAVRSATLSSSTGRQEIAMASQTIGDGMVLDMSLELDESAPLRAATPILLENGKTFRVIALNTASGKYMSHADFTIVNGVSNTNASLHVPEGVSHDFICLSYNDNSTTGDIFSATYVADAVPDALPVPTNNKDLLYAKTTATITSSNKTISFLLEHKLSKVTVVLDGTYNNWSVSSVSSSIRLQPFYDQAKVDLQSGGVTKGAASTTQYFGNWMSGSYTQTSAPRTIFTNGEGISLILPANAAYMGSVGYRPSSQKTVTFSGLYYLAPGNSYTLRVRMRVPKWAGSNIYWNGSAMVFDLNGTTTHESYQGLFFKYRSLVGTSPVGDFSNSTPIYKVGSSSSSTASDWDQVPYGNGDICQTLDGAYRLPRSGEFGTVNFNWSTPDIDKQGWVNDGGGVVGGTSSDDTGRKTLSHFAKNTIMGNVRFPASSQRGSDGSAVNLVNYSGYYWYETGAGLMDFDMNVFNAYTSADTRCGFPIRCVVN
jgi:hypothetical protein